MSLNKLFFLSLILLQFACSHPLEIVGEGDIWSLTKTRDCTMEQSPCKNLVSGAYEEIYTAVARDGWEFSHWQNYCANSAGSCSFKASKETVEKNWSKTMPALIAHFKPVETTPEPPAPEPPNPEPPSISVPDVAVGLARVRQRGGTELVFDPPMTGVEFYSNRNSACNIFNYPGCGGGVLVTIPEHAIADARLTQASHAYYQFRGNGRTSPQIPVSVKQFTGRTGHDVVFFNNRLWVIGGGRRFESFGTSFQNTGDIWSSIDGKTWILENASPAFGLRRGHQVFVYGGQMLLFGGNDYTDNVNGVDKNDVWASNDGINWELQVASAEFSPRSGHQMAVYNGDLWLIGGFSNGAGMSDVWTSADGKSWSLVSESGELGPLRRHQLFAYFGQLWLTGSELDSTVGIWSSQDGVQWDRKYTGNALVPEMAVGRFIVHNDQLWLLGAHVSNCPTNVDICQSSGGPVLAPTLRSYDGNSWETVPVNVTQARNFPHNSHAIHFNNRMFMIGGTQWRSEFHYPANYVLSSSDGQEWLVENSDYVSLPSSAATRGIRRTGVTNGRIWVENPVSAYGDYGVFSSANGIVWQPEPEYGSALPANAELPEPSPDLNVSTLTSLQNFSHLQIAEQSNEYYGQHWAIVHYRFAGGSKRPSDMWNSTGNGAWARRDVALPFDPASADFLSFDGALWLIDTSQNSGNSIWTSTDGYIWSEPYHFSIRFP